MDDEGKIGRAVKKAISEDVDMVMIIGGSSAGSEDLRQESHFRSG
jgi:molybdopterin biosynthesis enzyme